MPCTGVSLAGHSAFVCMPEHQLVGQGIVNAQTDQINPCYSEKFSYFIATIALSVVCEMVYGI